MRECASRGWVHRPPVPPTILPKHLPAEDILGADVPLWPTEQLSSSRSRESSSISSETGDFMRGPPMEARNYKVRGRVGLTLRATSWLQSLQWYRIEHLLPRKQRPGITLAPHIVPWIIAGRDFAGIKVLMAGDPAQ